MSNFLKNNFPYNSPEWEKREKQIRRHSVFLIIMCVVVLSCITLVIVDLLIWKSGTVYIITSILAVIEPLITITYIIIDHNKGEKK